MEQQIVRRHIPVIPGKAYLYKTSTKAKNGKRYQPSRWYGKWKNDADRWQAKALHDDENLARKMLLKIVIDGEMESLAPRRIPLRKLVDQFVEGIGTNSTPGYAGQVKYRVNALLDEAGATHPDHLEPDRIQIAAAQLVGGLHTRWYYLSSMRQFSRWLVDRGHARTHQLAGMKLPKFQTEIKYMRRALTREEWVKLTVATRSSTKSFRGLDGRDRLMLYSIGLSTGWRAGGLSQLRVQDFLPDGLLILRAKFSKNRKEQRKYLPPPLIEPLKAYLANREPHELIWPSTWGQDAAEMLRIDLKAAGIPYETVEGVLDFHAFRNASITWLLESGTPIYLVQRHADHASPAQTMRYARPKRGSVDEAVDKTFSQVML